jgi:hypothetical protein
MQRHEKTFVRRNTDYLPFDLFHGCRCSAANSANPVEARFPEFGNAAAT